MNAPAALSHQLKPGSQPDRMFASQVDWAFADGPAVDDTKALIADVVLKLLNDQSGLPPRQRSAQCLPYKEVKVRSVSHSPHPFDRNYVERATPMSSNKTPRTFRVRVKDALQRRVGKGKALTVKQLAHAIGCSEGTIENLMGSGTSDPSSRVLRELMMFFDDSFANEVWGCDGFMIVRLDHTKAAAVRRIMEAHDELRRLG